MVLNIEMNVQHLLNDFVTTAVEDSQQLSSAVALTLWIGSLWSEAYLGTCPGCHLKGAPRKELEELEQPDSRSAIDSLLFTGPVVCLPAFLLLYRLLLSLQRRRKGGSQIAESLPPTSPRKRNAEVIKQHRDNTAPGATTSRDSSAYDTC